MPPDVRVAGPADRDRVVDTVVEAFRADPAFRFFFPDHETYAAQAAAFAGYLFDKRVGHGTVWVVADGAAVSMWTPPGPIPYDGPAMDVPAATAARIDAYEAGAHTALPTEPYWYLGVLATHPAHAGQRWGRAVMGAGLARAAADRLPAYLETTSADNVGLYERSGREVTATIPVGPLEIRVLRHPPA
jgi:ribosomal protein S18 acetylase RimI-like enzyme